MVEALTCPTTAPGTECRARKPWAVQLRAGHSRSPVHVQEGTPPSERAVLVSHNQWPAVFKRIIHEHHVVGLRPQARKNR